MTKREVLQATTFGKRIAEEESAELASYFVETDQWQQILAGEVDVVYGGKGAGKSAIYSLLLSRAAALSDRGITVIGAEDPRGTPIFKGLVDDPPTSENEFRGLWKIYFLLLIGRHLRDAGVSNEPARVVLATLEEARLLPKDGSLRALLGSAVDYVKRFFRPGSIEGGMKIDPATGMPAGVTGKITFREPTPGQVELGLVSADHLLSLSNDALGQSDRKVWLLLDRLDVAFAESDELERNALRALFRVYLDLRAFACLVLKIFLRSDIWKRISRAGFREASHITRHVTIEWNPRTLLNLVIRRALRNDAIRAFYCVDEQATVHEAAKQSELFYRVFPDQVDVGQAKPRTLDWMLSRTSDGTRLTAPRELIHLLSRVRDVQLANLEVGHAEPSGETLFDRSSLKEALPEVSRVRLEQTLYAEFPALQPYLQKLESEKTAQTSETLAKIWAVTKDEADRIASDLVEVGFFERRGTKDAPVFWVPFLYRDGLGMVQGSAE